MTLSIVIPTRDDGADLRECLAALAPQCHSEVEVLVVDGSRLAPARLAEPALSSIRLISQPPDTGIAKLRAAGLEQASGQIIAFTEVCCRVAGDWIERLHDQDWSRYAAVGGVVGPGDWNRPEEWAVFLSDYGAHLPSRRPEEATLLAGNNVAFRRDALEHAGLVGESEFWKTFAVWRLKEQGERFWQDPGLVVRHVRLQSARSYLRQRYLHGRCFGGTRAAGRSRLYRLARAGSCPAVPFLVTFRLVRAMLSDRSIRSTIMRSLPHLLLFQAAWAWGELLGYLRGAADACACLS